MMTWSEIPETAERWAASASGVAGDVKSAAAGVITSSHVGYYYDPETGRSGLYGPTASRNDWANCKAACLRVTGHEAVDVSYGELSDRHGTWVKVAHSPTLRRAGELLNFFPGQYPGGVPNSPSPVASMLTTGLLGAGLGWGAGKLIGKLMPERFGNRLGRSGAVVGGLMGASPGALWMLANSRVGRGPMDGSMLAAPPDSDPLPEAESWTHGANGRRTSTKASAAIEKAASYYASSGDTMGGPPGSADVNIDALGRTLWEGGASPALAGTTMSAVYAAQQMPDPNAREGWATGPQLGQLAMRTAGDYGKGLAVGAALNAVVGTPYSARAFGTGSAVLGLIAAVVPKLFGG